MRLLACASALLLAPPVLAQPAEPVTTVPPDDAEVGTDAPLPDSVAQRDRFERLNRGVWGFNQGVDRIVIKPVSNAYRAVTPRPARRGIHRIFANLSEPWSFINNLLQGRANRAFTNLGRFVVNTTIGVGGLADHATKMGLRPAPEDFGQTLATWGVRSSAYVVLPLLGPSTVRDAAGTGVAFVADPYQIGLREVTNDQWVRRGVVALSVVDIRSQLTETGADGFLQSSLDPYAAARSAYLQRRGQQIANQDSAQMEPTPNLDPTQGSAPVPMPEGDTAPIPEAAAPALPPAATVAPAGETPPVAGPPATPETGTDPAPTNS